MNNDVIWNNVAGDVVSPNADVVVENKIRTRCMQTILRWFNGEEPSEKAKIAAACLLAVNTGKR